MTGAAEHCSFVLLADFDIDKGAQLTYQFPQPLGTDETSVIESAKTYNYANDPLNAIVF